MATPGLASRSGKARERRWRPFDQTQDRLFSTFPWRGSAEEIPSSFPPTLHKTRQAFEKLSGTLE